MTHDEAEKLNQSLERIADALESTNEQANVWFGLLHSDLETLMYVFGFLVPPILESLPNLTPEQRVAMVAKVMELLEVHRAQVKEISGWKGDENP